ncbi:F-box domain and ankyrin repeat protein [Reticulomyxa filosa]|uniref:F-box domain and ankyrin repeat protein n=1 Tax=Reticulomyxa filosa TaxID=46433 RepID=X6MV40_RETFI|nr:F-box domain and ankyrin repeat protein [Reticulomyxa filosa]|eukprot:ETO16955.1 F-box domain and ankyrin repeat protein [Reticulomyxa filosa]
MRKKTSSKDKEPIRVVSRRYKKVCHCMHAKNPVESVFLKLKWSQGARSCIMLFRMRHSRQYKQQNGHTPLHKAVDRGDLQIIQYLVDSGARVDLSGLDGFAPLHIAALKNDYTIIEYLLRKRADPNDITQDNKKAIDLTSDEKCKQLLLKYMEKPNDTDLIASDLSEEESIAAYSTGSEKE